MPELPEVRRVTEALKSELEGNYLQQLILHKKCRYHGEGREIKGIRHLNVEKKIGEDEEIIYEMNAKVKEIIRRGKKIFFRLLMPGKRIIYMYSFLALTGTWNFSSSVPHKRMTLIVGRKKGKMIISEDLIFSDPRNFGALEFFASESEFSHIMKDTGPDYFSAETTLELFTEKIRNKRIKSKEIAIYLLEQKHFSGIGTYLRSESLYRAGLSPYRILESLTDSEIYGLYHGIIFTTKESYDKGGYSFKDYHDPHGVKGTFKTLVHDKETDPFGNKVIKVELSDGRVNYFCPEIQK
jgi:DNA-formamidopyrimidine glycosylase